MSNSAPEVLVGARAPRTVRMEESRKRAEAAPPQAGPAPSPDFNVYVARDRRYRVQITAPQKMVLADGRVQSGGKMIVALFDEGVYRNNHRDPKVRALIDEALQSNPYFGKFGSSTAHFWLASDQRAKTEAASIANALAVIKSLPKEAVEQFVGELAQSELQDHALPAAK